MIYLLHIYDGIREAFESFANSIGVPPIFLMFSLYILWGLIGIRKNVENWEELDTNIKFWVILYFIILILLALGIILNVIKTSRIP